MFCEGIHLHLVLVVVFVKDAVAMKIFRLIGWILPVIFVSFYSILRKQNADDSKMYVDDRLRFCLFVGADDTRLDLKFKIFPFSHFTFHN